MDVHDYLRKMSGGGAGQQHSSAIDMFWSWLGSFLGIAACGLLSVTFFEPRDATLLIGSFGASAVLLYAAIRSPLAQPRNLVLGHIVSALVGVGVYRYVGDTLWLAAALAVSLAIVAMLLTKSLHPPGGATALIAVLGGPGIHELGYAYAIVPAGLGALILLVIALLVNNLARHRRYPDHWL
jgi:CBS-domain-containing membrane protein